ncbi:Bro-N domain-containing protein [Agitococcus lubricus]|uniref:Prophage antirepressor-like protein n=1 Tax=Agitococcus lubricus TaxID=1077255 RepID=A0A2T5ISC1_9GAMM|nr:Bro-N domain-containing protein [Agitococcus lubricus]PTQ86727.1 prophage antirepressor-like protein [Agitococcus lubricus]
MTTNALTFDNTVFEIIDFSGMCWLRGYQIGSALGYSQPDAAISKIYDRNADEFTDQMTTILELDTSGGKQKTRIFSLRGAHLIAMLARTPIAKAFRKWVLDILDKQTTAQTSPDTTETLSQTLNQLSKGNKKLYMSMYNGLTRRFAIGRLADIPHAEIHNALATIYFFAVEWHRKNTPTQLPLKLNDGEWYLVVKNGVVLWERKLKPNCNDIPANTLQNPKLMLEHIREVVGEFVGQPALEHENNLVMISRDTTNKVMDYFAALRHEINRLGGKLPVAPNFDKEAIVRAVITDMMDSSRMLVSFDFITGKPQITFVPNDCFVASRDNIANLIAGSDGVPRKYLPDIIKAVANRLAGN